MSTVSGFLLIIASGDRSRPLSAQLPPALKASDKEIEWISYSAMIAVGTLVTMIALKPPKYLQLVIVFSSSGMASAFLMPALLGAFWRRTTAYGAIAAMLGGTATTIEPLPLHRLPPRGWDKPREGVTIPVSVPGGGAIRPPYYCLLGFDPCVWGLFNSLAAGVFVSLLTAPPDPYRVSLLFDRQPENAPAPASVLKEG